MPRQEPNRRLLQPSDLGRLIAEGRKRTRLSQQEFASRLGVSRKTLSELERGVAQHVSLKTALKALSLAGFVLNATVRRPPSLAEVMATRAEHRTRADELGQPEAPAKDWKP